MQSDRQAEDGACPGWGWLDMLDSTNLQRRRLHGADASNAFIFVMIPTVEAVPVLLPPPDPLPRVQLSVRDSGCFFLKSFNGCFSWF